MVLDMFGDSGTTGIAAAEDSFVNKNQLEERQMKKSIIISIAIEKGGVAKTTTALNLGAALHCLGKKVLLIDLDPQGSLSSYLGYDFSPAITMNELIYNEVANQPYEIGKIIRTNAEGLDYIPSSKMLSTAITILGAAGALSQTVLYRILHRPELSVYDYIIIDCRTSLDLLTVNALAASDKLIIPVQAEPFGVEGLAGVMDSMSNVCRSQNSSLTLGGILITMAATRTTMAQDVEQLLREKFGSKVFKTVIPRLSEAPKSTADQRSLVQTKNSRLGAKYLEVAKEIING
ncbi:MAG: ParA family protein [Angelakisella sp.]